MSMTDARRCSRNGGEPVIFARRGQAVGEPLRGNPSAQAKIEAGGRNDLRIGKLALVGAEVTLEILLRDEASCDQFFPNIQDEIAKDGPSAVAGGVRLDGDVYRDVDETPEFWGEVQPPASLKGLDIPPRRAVFVPWKSSRRPAFGMGNPTFR